MISLFSLKTRIENFIFCSLDGPIVHLDPRREVSEGDDVKLKCSVQSNPHPQTIEWTKEGDPSFKQTGNVLHFPHVTAANYGTYTCRAVNILSLANGRTERVANASTMLLIRHRPGETQIVPDRPIGIDGESISLSCLINPPGFPEPRIRWWRDGSDTTLSSNSNMSLNPVTLNSEGVYHCQATNELGSGPIASAQLRVYGKNLYKMDVQNWTFFMVLSNCRGTKNGQCPNFSSDETCWRKQFQCFVFGKRKAKTGRSMAA